MPIYKFQCPECGKVDEDVFVKTFDEEHRCTVCGKTSARIYSGVAIPNVFPAEGIFFEHVSAEGKRFFSKQEIKDYAKANDLEFDYLD